MTRFAVAGYYGFGNIGDEAILASMIADLRREYPGCRFEILSACYAPTAEGADIAHVPWTDWHAVVQAVGRCDLLVVGGGGLYNSYLEYDPNLLMAGAPDNFAAFIYSLPVLAYLLGKPCSISGVGASYFNSAEALADARASVELATTCTVRDAESRDILQGGGGGGGGGSIEVTADWAFRFPDSGATPLRQQGLPPDANTIAVAVRNWNFGVDPAAWEREVLSGVRTFAARQRLAVLLIPFHGCADIGPYLNADPAIAERWRADLAEAVPVQVLPRGLTAGEVSGVIAGCSIVLGMRLHACILAIRNAVPLVALPYASKVRLVMERCGLGEHMVALSTVRAADLDEALERAYTRRAELQARLGAATREMAQAAYGNVEAIHRALDSAQPERPSAGQWRMLRRVGAAQARLHADDLRAVRLRDAEVAAYRPLLREAIANGHYDAALRTLDELLRNCEPNGEWYYLKAFCLHSTGRDFTTAESCYGEALRLGFDEFWVRFQRGQLWLAAKPREAYRDLVRAAEMRPAEIRPDLLERARSRVPGAAAKEAEDAFARGDYGLTVERAREAAALDATNGKAYYLLALGLQSSAGCRIDEALRAYTMALRNGFDPFWVAYNRAQLFLTSGRLEEAQVDLARAQELNPEHPGIASVQQAIAQASAPGPQQTGLIP